MTNIYCYRYPEDFFFLIVCRPLMATPTLSQVKPAGHSSVENVFGQPPGVWIHTVYLSMIQDITFKFSDTHNTNIQHAVTELPSSGY